MVRHSEKNDCWAVHAEEMERAIDKNTKLVSLALVSNINGYLHEVRRTSEAAHRHGAFLYADIIQGASSVPIDVQAMGIDFAACGAYKWLMGDFGFGFLYVRRWEFTEPAGGVRIVPGMRISPSVYNNQANIERLLEALA